MVTCLETFDWYSSPRSRGGVAGLQVMRAAMRAPEPLVNVGGSEDTLAILPRLGWRTVDRAAAFVLPLRAGAVTTEVAERHPRAAGPAGRAALAVAGPAWFGRGRARGPAGGEVVPVSCPGPEVLNLYRGATGYALVPLPDLDHLRWLTTGFAGAGQFATLYFTVGGRLRGWGMTRTYPGDNGREAALVEAFAPRPEPGLYAWMIRALLEGVAGHRPVRVRAQATCPALVAALRRLRFIGSVTHPVQVWAGDRELAGRPTHFTMSTQDFPMLPYPERWDDMLIDGAAATAPARTEEARAV
jgi:hypothetical protein